MWKESEKVAAGTISALEDRIKQLENSSRRSLEKHAHNFHLSHRAIHVGVHTLARAPMMRNAGQGLEHLGHLVTSIGFGFGPMGIAAGAAFGLLASSVGRAVEKMSELKKIAAEALTGAAKSGKSMEAAAAEAAITAGGKALEERLQPSWWQKLKEKAGISSKAGFERAAEQDIHKAVHQTMRMTESPFAKRMQKEVFGPLHGKMMLSELKEAAEFSSAAPVESKKEAELRKALAKGEINVKQFNEGMKDLNKTLHDEYLSQTSKKMKEQAENAGLSEMAVLRLENARKKLTKAESDALINYKLEENLKKALKKSGDDARTAEMTPEEVRALQRAEEEMDQADNDAILTQDRLTAKRKEAFGVITSLTKQIESYGLSQGEFLARQLEKLGGPHNQEQAALLRHKDAVERSMKVVEETLTPLEKYSDRMVDLNDLLRSGQLSEDRYAMAVMRARRELDGKSHALKGVQAAEAGSAEHQARINEFLENQNPLLLGPEPPTKAEKTVRAEFPEAKELTSVLTRNVDALNRLADAMGSITEEDLDL
jgi:hypothetical protein